MVEIGRCFFKSAQCLLARVTTSIYIDIHIKRIKLDENHTKICGVKFSSMQLVPNKIQIFNQYCYVLFNIMQNNYFIIMPSFFIFFISMYVMYIGCPMEEVVSSECVNMELNEDNDVSEGTTTPLVEDKVEEPKVGMLFNSIDEVNDFYLRYGKKMGFAVCRRSCRKGDDGEVRYVTVTCQREGKSRRSSSKPVYLQPEQKTNCRARVSAALCPDRKWVISSVVLEHNHELSPNKSMFYRCKRVKQPGGKRRLEPNDKTNIQMNRSFYSSVVEAGGYENLPFQEKDSRNYDDRAQYLRLGEGDATAINNYFLKMQVDNSDFFYTVDFNVENRIKNVFWADARSRAACKVFGDVVTLDTRYLINKYKVPLVLFLGANHHGQPILLGCGMICSEDVNTLTWLFRSWLACMSRTPPSGIITDQDEVVKRAIEIVFPNARHRWCLWHVMEKLHDKLKSHKQYESIKLCIQTAVYYSMTTTEFEESWCKLITEYDLKDNEWLSGLYEERKRWVLAFVRDSFWAGMSIAQQSEGLNSFFDRYVNSKTSIRKFLEQYLNAMRSKVEEENEEDLKSLNSMLPCITHYEIEKQFQKAYTTTKFKEFQQELMGKIYCEVSSCLEGVSVIEYEIYEDVFIGENIQRVIFKVCFHADIEEVECNCRLFQFSGILCRHAITVLTRRKVRQIPDKYILNRWSKRVKWVYRSVKISYDDWSAKPEARSFEKMCNAFHEVVGMVAKSDESKVIAWIHELKKNLETDSCGSNQTISKKSNDAPSCGDGSATYK